MLLSRNSFPHNDYGVNRHSRPVFVLVDLHMLEVPCYALIVRRLLISNIDPTVSKKTILKFDTSRFNSILQALSHQVYRIA